MSGKGGHDFVRPFIMTGGRTSAAAEHVSLRLESLVERRTGSTVTATMPSEQRSVLALCDRAISVAELSSELGIVVGVMPSGLSMSSTSAPKARIVWIFSSAKQVALTIRSG